MKNTILLLIISFLMLGCSSAKKRSEIQAVRTPIAPYLKLTCQELVDEQQSLMKDLEASGVAVDKAYSSDKTTEIVTWVLFAPAAFFLKGNENEASKYASQKGQMDTINEALKVNKCGTR